MDKVEDELRRLKQADVLLPIQTLTWVSNIVVVLKSNSEIQNYCDFSDLYEAFNPYHYPLPTIVELSMFFALARYFIKIDLKWGYLQVMFQILVIHLTTMITPHELFQCKRLPFGLK